MYHNTINITHNAYPLNLSFKNNYIVNFSINREDDISDIIKNKEILKNITPNASNIYYSLEENLLYKVKNLSDVNELLSPFNLNLNDFTIENYMKLGINNII